MRTVPLFFVLAVIIFGSVIATGITVVANEAKENEEMDRAAKFVCNETRQVPESIEIIDYAKQRENTVFILTATASSLEMIEGETTSSKELKTVARQVEKVHRGVDDYPIIATKWNAYWDISCESANHPSPENREKFVKRTLELPIELLVITSVYGQMDEELLRDLLSYLPEDARNEIESFLEDNYGKELLSDLKESIKPEDALDQFGKWFDNIT